MGKLVAIFAAAAALAVSAAASASPVHSSGTINTHQTMKSAPPLYPPIGGSH